MNPERVMQGPQCEIWRGSFHNNDRFAEDYPAYYTATWEIQNMLIEIVLQSLRSELCAVCYTEEADRRTPQLTNQNVKGQFTPK